MQEERELFYKQNEEVYKKIEETFKSMIEADKDNAYLYKEQLNNIANGLRIEIQAGTPTFRKELYIYNKMVEASFGRKKAREYQENWDI